MSKFHSGPFSHRGFREMATRPVSLKFGAQAVDLTMQPAIERGCLMATICCFIQQEQSKTLQETVQNSEHLEKTIQSLDEMRRNGETVNKVEACHDCISRKNFTALCKRVERANHAGSRDTRFVPIPWKEEFRTAATFGVLIVYSRPDSLKKVFIKIYSYFLVLINRILNRVCYKRKKSWEWCRVRRTIWNRISIQLYKINRSEARVIFIDIHDNNCTHVIFAALPVASGVFLAIPEANFVPRVLSPTRRSVETGRRENLATRFSWREFCGSLFCFCSVCCFLNGESSPIFVNLLYTLV